MSDTPDKHAPDRDQPRRGPERRPIAYEPPRLVVLGTFHDLTRQQLKVSGSADFVNFRPSH